MSRFTAELVTDIGQMRDHNEDYALVRTVHHPHGTFHLWIVADGMGGGARGEVASQLAAQTVADYISLCEWDEPEEALRTAFEQANAAVYAEGTGDGSASRSQMGTTLVVALVDDASGETVVANVGDSRAYLVRGNEIRQLTRDHSLVAERLAAELMTEEEARNSDERNIITRAVGTDATVAVDVAPRCSLGRGMRFVLCSDGLHGLVSDEEILRQVATSSLDRSARALVRDANAAGGRDNITVLVAGVGGSEARAPLVPPEEFRSSRTTVRKRRPRRSLLLAVAGGSFVALLVFAFRMAGVMGGGSASPPAEPAETVGSRVNPGTTTAPAFSTSAQPPTVSGDSPQTSTAAAAPRTITRAPEATSGSIEATGIPNSTPTEPAGSPPAVLWSPAQATLSPDTKHCHIVLRVPVSIVGTAYAYLRLDRRDGDSFYGISTELSTSDEALVSIDVPLPASTALEIQVVISSEEGGPEVENGIRKVGTVEVDALGACGVTLAQPTGGRG